ncbi:APC family permease [Spiroplasma alleghenense]|uniref:Amino acid permease n=1 Tax=Spiroplasma alleghenense TaxID=216931 RepID=A0A345Z2S2_9MOLU|nr:APC family permease [Spiroplasma alleghenense]AXK50901.1 amino acid permease [Spiroplasma alleghenense]
MSNLTKKQKSNKRTNKVFEFLTLFSLVFGLMVGSGIYLKNRNTAGGVLGEAGQNPYLAITMWLVIGLVSTLMILVFVEAASSTKNQGHSTIQTWGSKFLGRRVGSFYAIFFIMFYVPVLSGIGALFSVKTIIDATDKLVGEQWLSHEGKLAIQGSFAILMMIGFMVLNMLTTKPGHLIQTIFTFFKFIPLAIVIIGGFILNFQGNDNAFDNSSGEWKTEYFFLTMAPILFSFDGFIFAAALQKDVEHKEVVAPGLFFGVLGVSLFYVLISIAIFFGSVDGNVFTLFDNLFQKAPGWSFFFKSVVACTIMTIVNGYSIVGPKGVQASMDDNLIFNKKDKIVSHRVAAVIQGIISLSIVSLLITCSVIINNNLIDIIDFTSNTITVMAFTIYLSVLIGVLVNRKTKRVEVEKVKGVYWFAAFPILFLTVSMSYVYFDLFKKFSSVETMFDPLFFIFSLVVMFILWGANEKLLKKYNSQKEISKLVK